jgi:hypothetical protein
MIAVCFFQNVGIQQDYIVLPPKCSLLNAMWSQHDYCKFHLLLWFKELLNFAMFSDSLLVICVS